MNFNEIENKVQSKSDLIDFIKSLKQDFEHNQQEWENTSVLSFLEAMESWTEDTNLLSEEPKWSEFAKILFAGSRYE